MYSATSHIQQLQWRLGLGENRIKQRLVVVQTDFLYFR